MFFEIILLLILIFINDLVYSKYVNVKIKKIFSKIIKLKNLREKNDLNKVLKLFFLSLTYIWGCFLMFKYFPNLNFIIKTFLPSLLYLKFLIGMNYE